jgi:hypothetical protein
MQRVRDGLFLIASAPALAASLATSLAEVA